MTLSIALLLSFIAGTANGLRLARPRPPLPVAYVSPRLGGVRWEIDRGAMWRRCS